MYRPYSGWYTGTTTLFTPTKLSAYIRTRVIWAHLSGQLDEMLSTMACNFAKISVCRSDSLVFLAASSKDATMYSISRHGQSAIIPAGPKPEYLVAPEQLISTTVLEPIPRVQELGDAVRTDVVGELLRILP